MSITANQLANDLRQHVNDANAVVWSDGEIINAITRTLRESWPTFVSIPQSGLV